VCCLPAKLRHSAHRLRCGVLCVYVVCVCVCVCGSLQLLYVFVRVFTLAWSCSICVVLFMLYVHVLFMSSRVYAVLCVILLCSHEFGGGCLLTPFLRDFDCFVCVLFVCLFVSSCRCWPSHWPFSPLSSLFTLLFSPLPVRRASMRPTYSAKTGRTQKGDTEH